MKEEGARKRDYIEEKCLSEGWVVIVNVYSSKKETYHMELGGEIVGIKLKNKIQ